MPDTKRPSPAMLAFMRLVVCSAGVLCAVFLVMALSTGEATILTKGHTQVFYWRTEPEAFLAALGFYAVVIGAALWAVFSWVRDRK